MEQPWQSVRQNLEDHAQYLFWQFSTIYRVLEEASFANDEGGVMMMMMMMMIESK